MIWSLGLVFGSDLEEVVLLRKGKTLHVGLWNGVGGKVESGELPIASMVRECREETGLRVLADLWEEVGTIGFPGGNRVHVFATWIANVTNRGIAIADPSIDAWPNDKPVVVSIGKISRLPLAPHVEILTYAATQKLRDLSRAPIHIQEVARF